MPTLRKTNCTPAMCPRCMSRARSSLPAGWASILLILLGGFPLWANALLCVALGFAMAGIGLNIGHDANHGGYSDSRAHQPADEPHDGVDRLEQLCVAGAA